MMKEVKVAMLQTLLVSYIFLPLITCQQLVSQTGVVGTSVHNTNFQGTGAFANTNLQTAGTVPNTYYQGASLVPNLQGAAKGYSNTPVIPNTYMNTPVHGQYWTGQAVNQYYPQYTQQQYGAYNQQGYGSYDQYGSNYYPTAGLPLQQQYYPQQYSVYGQNNQYGHYPGFDAQYWTGNYYPQHVPVYQHGMPVYQGGMVYPGQYVRHPQYPGAYPYSHKPYKKGFLGGPKSGLAKTLLGAVVVGTVAGAVARG